LRPPQSSSRQAGCPRAESGEVMTRTASSGPFVSLLSEPIGSMLARAPGEKVLGVPKGDIAAAVRQVETHCHRLYPGETVQPLQMMAMRQTDPEMSNAMLQRHMKGETTPLGKIMERDVYRMLAKIEQAEADAAPGDGSVRWLERIRPDWTDAVTLARSIFVSIDRGDIECLSEVSRQCGSSVYSFAVLVTLMRAAKLDDVDLAAQIWSFNDLPSGGRLVSGVMPETFWAMGEEMLDDLFQPMQTCKLKVGEATTCPICLEGMAEGEIVRPLRCSHKFHTECIAEWIEKQWGQVNHVFGNIERMSIAKCPVCRASTGV